MPSAVSTTGISPCVAVATCTGCGWLASAPAPPRPARPPLAPLALAALAPPAGPPHGCQRHTTMPADDQRRDDQRDVASPMAVCHRSSDLPLVSRRRTAAAGWKPGRRVREVSECFCCSSIGSVRWLALMLAARALVPLRKSSADRHAGGMTGGCRQRTRAQMFSAMLRRDAEQRC